MCQGVWIINPIPQPGSRLSQVDHPDCRLHICHLHSSLPPSTSIATVAHTDVLCLHRHRPRPLPPRYAFSRAGALRTFSFLPRGNRSSGEVGIILLYFKLHIPYNYTTLVGFLIKFLLL